MRSEQKKDNRCEEMAKSKVHLRTTFYLVVPVVTTRYRSGVERIPEHIPKVIFVSSRVDSVMFEKSLVFPRE